MNTENIRRINADDTLSICEKIDIRASYNRLNGVTVGRHYATPFTPASSYARVIIRGYRRRHNLTTAVIL